MRKPRLREDQGGDPAHLGLAVAQSDFQPHVGLAFDVLSCGKGPVNVGWLSKGHRGIVCLGMNSGYSGLAGAMLAGTGLPLAHRSRALGRS